MGTRGEISCGKIKKFLKKYKYSEPLKPKQKWVRNAVTYFSVIYPEKPYDKQPVTIYGAVVYHFILK